MGKSRSKLYYWLPVIVLFGMCLILAVVVIAAAPQVLKAATGISLPGSGWTARLEAALSKLGFQIHGARVTSAPGEKQQLELTIGSSLEGQAVDPYSLISGVHLVAYAALNSPDSNPPEVDLVMVRVVDSQGNFLYSVLLDLQIIRSVIDQEITEGEYLNFWILSGDPPEFKVLHP